MYNKRCKESNINKIRSNVIFVNILGSDRMNFGLRLENQYFYSFVYCIVKD